MEDREEETRGTKTTNKTITCSAIDCDPKRGLVNYLSNPFRVPRRARGGLIKCHSAEQAPSPIEG